MGMQKVAVVLNATPVNLKLRFRLWSFCFRIQGSGFFFFSSFFRLAVDPESNCIAGANITDS